MTGKILTGSKFDEERKSGVKYIDITRSSGHPLAPSWNLVKWYKMSDKTKMNQSKFVRQYIKEMRRDMYCRDLIEDMVDSDYDICLLGYGNENAFSHRHIVARIVKYRRYGFDWETIFKEINDLGWQAGFKEEV